MKPNSDGFKRCSRGIACVHPDGPLLPASKQYFSGDKTRPDGLYRMCKACKKRHTIDRCLAANASAGTVFKRCSQGAACIHPEGPVLPASKRYFHLDQSRPSGFAPKCRQCKKQADDNRRHAAAEAKAQAKAKQPWKPTRILYFEDLTP